jgi:DNA-binding transcriptional MerR regulator
VDGYSIGEVCKLLGIRPHVLRYWERELEFLHPEKDTGGRRRYSTDELQLLFRIRYLVQKRRMGLEGVRRAIWEGIDASSRFPVAEIRSLRRELLTVERLIARQRLRLESVVSEPKVSDIQI